MTVALLLINNSLMLEPNIDSVQIFVVLGLEQWLEVMGFQATWLVDRNSVAMIVWGEASLRDLRRVEKGANESNRSK